MKTGELCQRAVVTVGARDELLDAARLMREKHIGYLVVTEPSLPAADAKPVGVLTDRDIVVSVVAGGADPAVLCVGDVMTRDPVTVFEQDDLTMALAQMRRIGVRRLPVVGHRGELTGILSIDDALAAMASELQSIAGSIRREQRVEARQRR
jgi:CBS domain-containing protein